MAARELWGTPLRILERLLEAAGVGANKPSWEPEAILAALRAYAEEFGRPPAKGELEWPPTGYPSSRTVRRHFGSFTAGLRAAGLESRGQQQRWATEAIIGAMREFYREVARWPGLLTGRPLVKIGRRQAPSVGAA